MKKFIFSMLVVLCLAFSAYAETIIEWDAATSGPAPTSYTLYYSDDGGKTFPYTKTVMADITSIEVDTLGLSKGVEYQFKVRASNASGESEDSNVVRYTPTVYMPPADNAPALTIITPGPVTVKIQE